MIFSKENWAKVIVAVLFVVPAVSLLFGRNPIFDETWSMFDRRGTGHLCLADYRLRDSDGKSQPLAYQEILRILQSDEYLS